MKHTCLVLFSLCTCLVSAQSTNRLEFLEAYAWGDRTEALAMLVPDTDDAFYYTCLHYELEGDLQAFDREMERWKSKNRNRTTSRMQELIRRRNFRAFATQPEVTWDFLRNESGLRFHHRPRHAESSQTYPSVVRPDQVSLSTFLRQAGGSNFVGEFTDRGLELALQQNLSDTQRRQVLGRLRRPDLPGLVPMILQDLQTKDSQGFGTLPVHKLLTRPQLEALGQEMPSLLQNASYVTERLSRFETPAGPLSQNHPAAVEYYEQVWSFVKTLGEMHNSLKAATLYQLLDHQRRVGVYEEERFHTYLSLPRPVPYLPRERRELFSRQRATWVDFAYRPHGPAGVPAIRDEEPLVRDFLLRLLAEDETPEDYAAFFEQEWLGRVFAESKLLAGIGEPKDWSAYLPASEYRSILDRVEVSLALDNPTRHFPGEPVSLAADIKHVDRLLVKVYELHPFNYYATHRAPVDQSVDLEGMVPTYEKQIDLDAPPAERNRMMLDLPEITDRGVYVVELIGNGVSSRALLQVGHLEAITQSTGQGLVMMILNEAGDAVKDGRVWLDGQEFTANEQGLVLIPFSENPGSRFVILRDGDFASPDQIQHPGESYTFSAGIHVDRQTLNRRTAGTLILRPDLRLHGFPLSPEMLQDVTVTLATMDAKGIRSEREFSAEFVTATEWVRSFYVPEGLRQVEVSVSATLTRKVDGEEITLADQQVIPVNQARSGDALRQVFLLPAAAGWILEVRGLNGEPVSGEPLRLAFSHPAFTDTVDTNVTTNEEGRVYMNGLPGLSRLRVTGNNLQLDTTLMEGRVALPDRLHLQSGQPVSLPYPGTTSTGLQAVSLMQHLQGVNLEDRSELVTLGNGELQIPGLPPGRYTLTLHDSGISCQLLVIDGQNRSGFLVGDLQRAQVTDVTLPSLAKVDVEEGEATLRIRNATRSTRVALRAARFAGSNLGFPAGQGFTPPSHRQVIPPAAQYISGRQLGDEIRYVLERQYRRIFAGTLLERPGLILNPWEIRETSADEEKLRMDEAYQSGRQRLNEAAGMVADSVSAGRSFRDQDGLGYARQDAGSIGVDFLPEGSRWWVNLRPEKDGTLRVPLGELGEQTQLEIVVLDRMGTSVTRYRLPDRNFEPREVRLDAGLDPDQAFSRQKSIRTLTAGESVTFQDLSTMRHTTLQTVGDLFGVLKTLSGNPELVDFSTLTRWPELSREEKLSHYHETASHELHLFLYQRDPEFFAEVVAPFLQNKLHKTFVDRWLLKELTGEDVRLDHLQHRNALELALLARWSPVAKTAQFALQEAWELLSVDPEAAARRVRVALQAGELDAEASLARDRQMEQAKSLSSSLSRAGARRERASFSADASGVGAAAPAMAPPASRAIASLALEEAELDMEMPEEVSVLVGEEALGFDDSERRLYRALPKTKEWAEQNYYKVRAAADVPGRLTVNTFWLDVAKGVEVSPHVLEAHRNLTDVIVALAFCGLPFEAEPVVEKLDAPSLTLTSSSPALLVSEQILPAEESEDDRLLLVSQQFFRPDDQYRYEGNEQIEKFVTGEFIRQTVYGARVTLTNPTSSRRRLNLLMQVPLGAIPLRNGLYTEDVDVELSGYTTKTVEIYFTFPESGTYVQFPAHVAEKEKIVGRADVREFRVVDAPTEVDKTSWAWISQYAENEDVLAFLRDHNLRRLELNDMAWRLKDPKFFSQAASLLTSRGWFHDTTFSYGIYHRDPATTRVWLSNSSFVGQVGPAFVSPLLTVDPVFRRTYEHLEYAPLVNPRTHEVGEDRKILNTAQRNQYLSHLRHQTYMGDVTSEARMGIIYHLHLQDRLEDVLDQLALLEPETVEQQMQLAYLQAWMAMRELDTEKARTLASAYADTPIPRWQKRFGDLLAQLNAEAPAEGEDPDRQMDLDRLAGLQPSLELEEVAGDLIMRAYQLEEVTLSLYPMDIELLFSRTPFLADGGSGFAVIRPAARQILNSTGTGEKQVIPLPQEFESANVMVEISGKGQRASLARLANELQVRKMEAFGQLEVRHQETGNALPKTYVKVFARDRRGNISFWKDGYTDLHGRFDYLSLNDRKPEEAAELSILVLHPDHGAEILQAEPPVR